MFSKTQILILCLIVAGTFACSLFTGKTDEVVYASTEVGTAEGPAAALNIGPTGGTLSSPDSRLTLVVPPNAVNETVRFSIQPITNKAANGLGLAYRLEPNGKTFAVPLELAFRYDDNDLEGTIPEALAIAYQDEKGAWHAQKTGMLDQTAKTRTISTTHFTDWAFLARLTLTPSNATLRPGQTQVIKAVLCEEPGLIDKILSRPGSCKPFNDWLEVWTVRGPGSVQESGEGSAVYTAPGQKPKPNTAWVTYTVDFKGWGDKTQSESTIRHQLNAKMTIIEDQVYQVIGQHGSLVLSGTICSLEEPFTIPGVITGYPMKYKFQFTPSSRTSGTVEWTGAGGKVGAEGGGTYTVEGLESGTPRIVMKSTSNVGHAPPGSATGPTGTGEFVVLMPLENAECRDG